MVKGELPEVELTTRHVRRVVDGDLSSLRWLVERFSPPLHAVAAHRLGPRLRASYDPADIVQDVWTAVLPRLGTLELRGPRATPTLLKYLTTAVVNRVRNLLERHIVQQVHGEASDDGLQSFADPASGILTKAVRAEGRESVHRALEELSERDRRIVILRGLEQQPLSIVAEHLGLKTGAAAVRFHRALKRLQEKLPDSVFGDLEATDA